jgi:hypothetical protein
VNPVTAAGRMLGGFTTVARISTFAIVTPKVAEFLVRVDADAKAASDLEQAAGPSPSRKEQSGPTAAVCRTLGRPADAFPHYSAITYLTGRRGGQSRQGKRRTGQRGEIRCRRGAAPSCERALVDWAGIDVESAERGTFLYLADGRLFVHREHRDVYEADEFERSYVAFLLTLDQDGRLDPVRGLELSPPSDS